jgi:hypothetical protein
MAHRFWAHVDKTGECWNWLGALTPNGYGRYSAKVFPSGIAHRIAWTLKHGPVPAGMDVCHRCDNRKCCRDEHLFLGTRKDNMQDASRKGRLRLQVYPWKASRGEAIGTARLTADLVREIRRRVEAGEQKTALGREFGVSDTAISHIMKRRNWRHVA